MAIGEIPVFGSKANVDKAYATQRRKKATGPSHNRNSSYYNTRPTIEVKLEDEPDEGEVKQPVYSGKSFKPTASQRIMVAGLSAFGIRNEGIATYLRISDDTLHRAFRDELETGFDKTEAALAAVLFIKALGGNMSAMSLLLRCKLGWTESRGGEGAASIESLSNEQRTQLITALRESLPAGEAGKRAPRKNKARLEPPAGAAD